MSSDEKTEPASRAEPSPRPITVSIVEDHRDTRERLSELLSGDPNLCFLDSYATGEDAVLELPVRPADVVLVDIRLPQMSGIECVAILKARLPRIQALMLTTYEEDDLIFRSIRAGASGYLLKDAPYARLVQAITEVHSGGSPMSMPIARKVVNHFREIPSPATEVETLTAREQEILALLARGRLDKQIADVLGIGLPTVRTHLRHIYEKLHVQSRTEAAMKFFGR